MCNNDVLTKINELIVTLEQNQNNQAYVDGVYNSFTTVLEGEMKKYLNPKEIVIDGINNKRRRIKKPWWNKELKLLWNDLCKYERSWLKCKNRTEKSVYKQLYVEKRTNFDRCVQRS